MSEPVVTPEEPRQRRVVHVSDFETPFSPASPQEEEAYRRRFVTLFADDDRSRRGGLGRVTHVTNALGEQFALKMLLPADPEGSPEATDALRAAFRYEYECQRSLASLRGFPRLYGRGLADGTPAIVMEWVEGVTLADARRLLALDEEGRISPLTVARLGRDLFDLIVRLSLVGDGLVHRDISPANVMVRTAHRSLEEQREDGLFDLCLIDFGSTDWARADASSFTRAHGAARHATADYAAPEMLSDDVVGMGEKRKSPAVDVYAAGSVLCELLGGRAPFRDVAGGIARASSAYRLKTEHEPARPVPAHLGSMDLAAVLASEEEVTPLVAPLALERGLSPHDAELRSALALADDQIVDAVMACLAVEQRRRPSAATMRDELAGLGERYVLNVQRALEGHSLTPCMTDAGWTSTGQGRGVARAMHVVALLVPAVAWLAIVGSAAWLVGMSSAVSGVAAGAILAVPGLAALIARGRGRATTRRLARGSGALAAAALLAAAAVVVVWRESPQMHGLLAALFGGCATTWCALVLDFVGDVAPGMMREARRRLPEPDAPEPARDLEGPKKARRLL